jgi:two-component system C4-dicarboxylate transport sensor histidine kinase DctB
VNLARHWPLLTAIVLILLATIGVRWWFDHLAASLSEVPSEIIRQADLALLLTGVLALVTTGLAYVAMDRQRAGLETDLAVIRGDLERQLERTTEDRRLALLGALAAGLAHELGQPLSAARVGIEGLHFLRQLGREPGPEHVERTLSRVGMSLLAMTETIEHLRGLAGSGGTRRMQPLALDACVAALLAERDRWLRSHDARIAWEPPPAPVPALGDPVALHLILTNLLRNAVEAVAGQGEERRLVRIALGPGPTVSVYDSGPGIPAEAMARIFDPFFTTKGGEARGIGLSLAWASAERMGAELQAHSTIGSGTVFTLRLLPVAEQA